MEYITNQDEPDVNDVDMDDDEEELVPPLGEEAEEEGEGEPDGGTATNDEM